MSLFKKKRNKNTEYVEELEQMSAETEGVYDEPHKEQEDIPVTGLDSLFTSPDDSGEDEDIASILSKYLSEETEEKVEDEINITFSESDAADTSEPTQDVLSEEEDPFRLSTLTSVGESDERFLKEVSDETEKPPLTADEAIMEFMMSVSRGESISELLDNKDDDGEDGIDIPPVFVESNAGETAEAEAEQVATAVAEAEPPLNADEIDFEAPAQEDGVGSTDMNLRIAFGLEEEDDDSDEMKDAVKKMGDHFEADKRVHKTYQPDHPEFTDVTQARDIAGEYKTRRRNIAIRLLFASAAAVILLIFENIASITELLTGSPKQFAGVLDPAVYPVVYVMISLQLLLICAVFALPELKRGVTRLFKGSPTPESITVFAVFAAVLASSLTAYQATVTVVPRVYNAAAAVSVIMALVYARLNVEREMITFFVAGSKRKKYAMNRIPDNETLLSPDDYNDDMYGDVMRVERTGFVDGFFSRMCVPDSMTSAFSAGLIGVSVAAAILFCVFAVSGGSVAKYVETAYVVMLSILPLAAHVAFSYPLFRASKVASDNDCAIVGETSLEEYAATAVVSFDDGNVFPSFGVKIQNIRIYNNARIDRVLYYASSAFKFAGGPLNDVFEVATIDVNRSDDVQITDADKNYLAATVDGVNIVFGSYPSLIERGFNISDSIASDDVDGFSDELSIMYMFREDMLVAKFYIKYVLDGDIEPILMQFQDYGMCLCVRTYDPNIDEDMICAKLKIKEPPVKVVRYRNADDARGTVERVDSGFVTFGSPKSLLQLLPYCDKTIHTKRTCGALTIMSVILALMVLAISSMSGGFGFINSLYISIYHVIWMLLASVAARLFIR